MRHETRNREYDARISWPIERWERTRRIRRGSLRTNVTVNADREIRSRIRAARRAHAALRARTSIASRRRRIRAALTVAANLIALATLTALSAIERVVLSILVGQTRTVAFLRSGRTIGNTRSVGTNGIAIARHAASAAVFTVRAEVDATCTGTIHEAGATSALAVVAELRAAALLSAHTAVVGVASRVDTRREASAIHSAHAHALTVYTGRTRGALGHAITAEARIGLDVGAELLIVLAGAKLLARSALALTGNASITNGTLGLALTTMVRIGRNVAARIAASHLTLGTNALTGHARRIGRAIISAHAAVVDVRGQIDATGIALRTEHGPGGANALPGDAHAIGAAADAAHPAVLRIARQIRARIRVVASHGVRGTSTALTRHTSLSGQTAVATIAAVLRIARQIHATRLARHQARITYAKTADA